MPSTRNTSTATKRKPSASKSVARSTKRGATSRNGRLGAVTVAARELKDRAVAVGRKMNARKAGAVAAAVTAAIATGLILRRKKK